ncbi:MAG: molybdopterin-guanine dinucleotide biosynthesis protein [Belnapia sp.]|nr:molybdopterin-guanine dinucleotide biosynthesis protein [Belnapia sp.]
MSERLEVPGTIRIPVAVLAERRPGVTRWAAWSWRAVEVLEQAPELPAWTLLREADGRSLFLAGRAEVMLCPTDTPNYRDNLEAASPRVWVVLRPVEAAPGLALHGVTVDAGEAHLYADSGGDLLESLPLPPGLRVALEAFVAAHHVERTQHKRRRDRADPEALGQRPGGRRDGTGGIE